MDRIMCIGELLILQIVNKMMGKEGSEADVEFNNEILLNHKNASYTDKRFVFYQKGCLCRYQWMEFLCRLAQKTYIEDKSIETYSQAFSKFYRRIDELTFR